MNICFSVCEYDPFHNGHAYHVSQMKNSGADFTVVIMSGSFTQRGEIAILDKYTRASHAIMAGADMVIELPTAFATSNAEIFASGAVKLINALGGGTLCFGSEQGTSEEFLKLAKISLNETDEFKKALKAELEKGLPFAVANVKAIEKTYSGVSTELLNSPNSVLGLEYVKAILRQNANVEIMPIKRVGAGFKDNNFEDKFCSASAIRGAISQLNREKAKSFVPDFVYKDLPNSLLDISETVIYSILQKSEKDLKKVLDCTEGLENRFKQCAKSAKSFAELIDLMETKRYTRARLSRIALQNALNITEDKIRNLLKSGAYIKVLAIKKEKTELLSILSNKIDKRTTSLITRKSDVDKLKGAKKVGFCIDEFALSVYNLVSGKNLNAYDMKII